MFQGILLLRLSAQLVKLNLLLEMLKGKLFLDPKKRKKKENQCTSWGWLIRVFYCQNFLCYLSFNGLLIYAVFIQNSLYLEIHDVACPAG